MINYSNYVKVVKISWLVIFVNLIIAGIFALIMSLFPHSLGHYLYMVIEFFRDLILKDAFNVNAADKVTMILLLSLPTLVVSILMVIYYIRAYKFTCPGCGVTVVKEKKVLFSLIPAEMCPKCGTVLK